jgi:cytochrome P450
LAALVDLVRATYTVPPCEEEAGIPSYLSALLEEDPTLLDDETLVGNIVCMLQLGSYDLAGLLLWTLKNLSDHPVWRERVYAELSNQATPSEGGLIDRIISETLRLEQSEFILRKTAETFEFGGFKIPKDWSVRICVRESHRDPALFDNPEGFDPDRFLQNDFSTRAYAPFGSGDTSCLARRLSHVVAGVFLCELVTHYSWTVLEDGPRMNDGFHWAPSKKFRIRLHSRAGSVTANASHDRT